MTLPDGTVKNIGSGSYDFTSTMPVQDEAVETDEFLYTNTSFPEAHSATITETKNGDLVAEYSSDGLHMVAAGYKAWAEYLAGHVAYSADNPYVMGSEYYIAK